MAVNVSRETCYKTTMSEGRR